MDFSSTADASMIIVSVYCFLKINHIAVKALEAAAKQISEADKKTLEKFLMDKAPEIKPRGKLYLK